jgi:hypothetical protein
MKWQEYQDAVGELYLQMDGIGTVRKGKSLPDKYTGQSRQIDVWLELDAKGHRIGILIDAKYRDGKIDVKDVEEVIALADAVGADKSVIVTANGWTAPAETRANFSGLDLRILSIEKALALIVPDMWRMCPACDSDCIIMDHDGVVGFGGGWLWWLAGRCRNCGSAMAWCQDCGEKIAIPLRNRAICGCGHRWINDPVGMLLGLCDEEEMISI